MRDGRRCVVVDARLRDIEPMAYDFLRKFARDNDLLVEDDPGSGLDQSPQANA